MSYSQLLSGLKEIGEPALLRKKSHLAFQGEIPRYGYYVLDGVVKAYIITNEGGEKLVDIYAKHSILPAAWLGHNSTTALFYYQAMNDVRAIRFSRSDFEKVIATNPSAHADYSRYLAESQMSLLVRVTGLCQTSASHKICYALYLLMLRHGVMQEDGRYLINVPLTHEIIGNFIGQSRENTAKTIKKLSEDGVMEYSSKQYIVDKARLEHYVGEDSFRDLV